jgi:hypothetical protein
VIDKGNRKTQSEFSCIERGYQAVADSQPLGASARQGSP